MSYCGWKNAWKNLKKKQIVSHPLCTCTVNTATYILMDSFGHSTLSIF